MSASGLRLHLDRPSPVGPEAGLTLVLSAGGANVEVKARVVWARARDGGHELGLEFVEPGSRTLAALFDLAWRAPDTAGPLPGVGIRI